MRRIFKIFSTGLAVVLLAACASTPQQRFASSVKDAQLANRPLVVYRFEHARVPERTADTTVRAHEFSTYVGVAFINTARQPIQKLILRFADYRDNRPMLISGGKPVEGTLVATGPFAADRSYGFVTKIWTTAVASNDSCPRLTGIEVTYQDGSRVAVPAETVSSYLTPQINVNCANYPAYIPGPEDLRFGNINGPIGYVPQHAPVEGKPGGGR